mmetsp:Transcript_2755/g.4321  ORF Transcript_2755/g.4321 Transcript_2755/m.4321 type:complete len:121 (-) Transcript_2755:993-1355(-)|eukprot:CAMPEP_0170484110 /NCGR_PEP_ID=MMETSP0208-20121228/3652_1 /TAXON_ID=197538 /ORGANISM="Strombidium inclinatum, Strain S3" /LENGTH=120 /DNA_ID=CAMNT_0010757369 /DNA_START=2705 /DNA_END=3067 /DNA_ORIENTATION=-
MASQAASKTPLFNRNYSIHQACLDSSNNTFYDEQVQTSQPEIPNISPIANHSSLISMGNHPKEIITSQELKKLTEEVNLVKSAHSSISANGEDTNAALSNSFSSIYNVPSRQVGKYCNGS